MLNKKPESLQSHGRSFNVQNVSHKSLGKEEQRGLGILTGLETTQLPNFILHSEQSRPCFTFEKKQERTESSSLRHHRLQKFIF